MLVWFDQDNRIPHIKNPTKQSHLNLFLYINAGSWPFSAPGEFYFSVGYVPKAQVNS